MSIVGRLDVTSINSALSGLRRHLDEAKTSSKSAFGDISRIGGMAASSLGAIATFGAGVAGAFLSLATLSPQAAPHIERMKTEFFRLSTIIGDVLEPVISHVSDAFTKFVDWMGSPEGQGIIEGVGGAIDAVVTSLETFAGFMTTYNIDVAVGDGLKWLVDNVLTPFGPEILAMLVGYKFGGVTGAIVSGAGTSLVHYGPQMVTEATNRIMSGEPGVNMMEYQNPISWMIGGYLRDLITSIFNPDSLESESEKWSQMKNAHTGGT